ncbi:hypothetical protein ABIA39_008954 [Nocardia sp. GAS34]|uniref:hypothetical protein n=1 Tax=unclassified Nocardia TaxID=2637762 RepID=UPI003D219B51
MRVTVVEPAKPGGRTTVRSKTGEWPAIWRGAESAVRGRDYDVEIEIDEIESWCDDPSTDENVSGIHLSNDAVVACGKISVVYDDGIFVLDLDPGSLMVDQEDISSAAKVGQYICLEAASVSLFPSGI